MRKKLGSYMLLLPFLLVFLGAGCTKAPRQKVFVLGIDGLTFDLLVPWVQEGKLPNFAQLLEEGSSTQLMSTIPPTSPPAWTSAVTGVNPGKHGVFGFTKSLKPSGDGGVERIFYTAEDRMADPLWIILSERGRRTVVINVPVSSPPDKIRGIMISGFPYTSPTNFTYPPEYRLKIPYYKRDIWEPLASENGEETFLANLQDVSTQQAKLVFGMLAEESWDLFFVVFTITDRVQHYFWKFMDPKHPYWEREKAQLYGDAILRAYQLMDDFLEQLRSRLDDTTTLLLMSDHGAGPIYQLINGWNFIDHLTLSDNSSATIIDMYGANFYLTSLKEPSYDRETRKGYVQSKELLKSKLEQLRDPATGQKVIQKVFEREDLFWGPYVTRAPHILSLETKGYRFLNGFSTEEKRLFIQKGDPAFGHLFAATHMLNGVLIMAGANVRKGVNNFDAQITDIAPTVLYLLGEPPPQEMDGKILAAPLSDEYIDNHALDARWARQSRHRKAEEPLDSDRVVNKFIEEQLKAIGYVQ